MAGLSVQIVMFDSDTFEDDEVGIVSDWFPYSTLARWVQTCKAATLPPGFQRVGDQCVITRTDDEMTREFAKNKGADGIWGRAGATFTYRIAITPTSWQ